MNFTVYSKEGCDYCERIKTVLRLTGSTYVVYNLGEDFTKEEFISEFGEEDPHSLKYHVMVKN